MSFSAAESISHSLDLAPIGPVDLAAERAELGSAFEDTALRVLRSGGYVLGPEVEAFERDFAAYQRASYGVGVGSGTDALILALRALGVRPGQKVLTTPYTFFASAGAIAWVGAVPSFVDVDPKTALMRTDQVAAALDQETVVLLPVHLYGQLCDVRALRELADARGVHLLEDAAQAHGAERDGVRSGQLGDAAAFSFYPTKNLGAAGEGGMVVTRDGELACRIAKMRDHGSVAKYVHDSVGTNSRLQALQGALLSLKLPHLDRWNARRRAIAAAYDAAFEGHAILRPLRVEPGSVHAYHQYALRVVAEAGARERLVEALNTERISAAVHYPRAVHCQVAAREWGVGPGDFPGAEQLAREVLCLPVHPFLSEADVQRVIEAILRHAPQ